MAVDPQKIARYLGRDGDPQALALAEEHVGIVTIFVKAYTRGNGFTETGDPNEDLSAVIVSATARYLVNPQQNLREQIGAQSITYAKLEGFTLAEQAVLHLYRKRAGS